MSRYRIPPTSALLATIPHAEVVVGWDNPLESFFGQIVDPDRPEDQDETVYWIGTTPQQISTLEDLCQAMAPYGSIETDTRAALAHDWQARTPPTPLQRHMLALLGQRSRHDRRDEARLGENTVRGGVTDGTD